MKLNIGDIIFCRLNGVHGRGEPAVGYVLTSENDVGENTIKWIHTYHPEHFTYNLGYNDLMTKEKAWVKSLHRVKKCLK